MSQDTSIVPVSLEQYGSSNCYGIAQGIAPNNFSLFFIPTNGIDLSSEVGLNQVWDKGILFFLDTTLLAPPQYATDISILVSKLNTFAPQLCAVLDDTSSPATIHASTATALVWLSGVSEVIKSGSFSSTNINNTLAFKVITEGTKSIGVTQSLQTIAFANYKLAIAKGTTISYENGINTFNIQGQSLYVPSVYWYKEEQLKDGSTVYKKTATVGWPLNSSHRNIEDMAVRLSLLGDNFGQWVFPVSLEKDTGKNLENDVQLFEIGLQYYYQDQQDSNDSFSCFYPFFDLSEEPVTLFATLDSLNLIDSSRSVFTFINTNNSYPNFKSTYKTLYGVSLELIPDASSQFVFSAKPSANGDPAYYLVPSGEFDVDLSAFRNLTSLDILCGTSGVECFSVVNKAGNPIQTISKLSMNFKTASGAVVTTLNGSATSFGDSYTTAWLALSLGASESSLEILYNIQPKHQHYYQVGQAGEPWQALTIPVATMPSQIVEGDHTHVPMVPYGGVFQRTNQAQLMGEKGLDLTFYQNFEKLESFALSPIRKALIENNFPEQITSDTLALYGTTPTGLCIGFNKDCTDWLSLTLANDSSDKKLVFNNIEGGFKKALQSDQLFMVISDQANHVAGFTTPTNMALDIGGWTFDFSLSQWSQHNTLCVFKYQKGKLYDLVVNDISQWQWLEATKTDGATNETQKRLTKILNTVKSQKASNPNYQFFWDTIVNNPEWQGVIFFNCPMSLSSIPSEFALLSNGINAEDFYAHHIAFSVNPVKGVTPGTPPTLDMDVSASYGLIDYQNAENVNTLSDYGYNVKSLEVRFVNGSSVNFKGSVQLQINNLFNHTATLWDTTSGKAATDQFITLNGAAQRTDGQMNVSFQNIGNALYHIENSVVSQMQVDNVKFFAVNTPEAGYTTGAEVQTRFLWNGSLQLINLLNDNSTAVGEGFVKEPFDLFGIETVDYNKAQLDMNFLFGKAQSTQYFWDISEIVINTSSAVLRSTSLASVIPLRLKQFMTNTNGATVQQLKFMPLNMESFKADTTLGKTWYGLVYDLNLGSLGALSDNKPFVLELILAWSPETHTDNIWAGIKVPGMSANGTFFNIEDLIKFGVQDVLLSTYGDDNLPKITFQSIGLSVLGQTFPPGGTTDLGIFGGEDNKSKLLAWLAAYQKSTTIQS